MVACSQLAIKIFSKQALVQLLATTNKERGALADKLSEADIYTLIKSTLNCMIRNEQSCVGQGQIRQNDVTHFQQQIINNFTAQI